MNSLPLNAVMVASVGCFFNHRLLVLSMERSPPCLAKFHTCVIIKKHSGHVAALSTFQNKIYSFSPALTSPHRRLHLHWMDSHRSSFTSMNKFSTSRTSSCVKYSLPCQPTADEGSIGLVCMDLHGMQMFKKKKNKPWLPARQSQNKMFKEVRVSTYFQMI